MNLNSWYNLTGQIQNHREEINSDVYRQCYTKSKVDGYDSPGDRKASVTLGRKDEICVDITANTGNGSCFIRRILPIHADQLAENGMFLKANPSIRFTNSK